VAGTLYVVATPLGNLGDLSPRAAQTLKSVALVAAEDTRHSRPLLTHIGSSAELVSFHAHSDEDHLRRLLDRLGGGQDVALITDAGTPLISDPGVSLVAGARARGIPVVTIPGPNAVVAALAVAGLPADRYTFLGFLPRKGGDRKRLLAMAAESPWTVVLFESPLRVETLLADLVEVCGGDRRGAVARELTKVFEETRAGTLAELAGYYADAPARGEVTVVVAGTGRDPAPRSESPAPDPEARARALLAEGLSRRDVAERLSEETGITRNTAYRLVNDL
jgi:16S rRNA (cytidine1402-2'-O)-methyltransferase